MDCQGGYRQTKTEKVRALMLGLTRQKEADKQTETETDKTGREKESFTETTSGLRRVGRKSFDIMNERAERARESHGEKIFDIMNERAERVRKRERRAFAS